MASFGLRSIISSYARKGQIIKRHYSSHGSDSNTLRILMLHGFTQSGRRFESKTQTLRDELRRGLLNTTTPRYRDIDFVFPTAPFALQRDALPSFDIDGARKQDEDIDAYTWWHIAGKRPPFHYEGLETAMSHIADTILRDGPFDGAMGFSQGAAATAMVASLLENGRKDAFDRAKPEGISYPSVFHRDGTIIHPPLKFAVTFSGFGGTRVPMYQGFYRPKITTPILHVLGKEDNFIKPAMSQDLIDACANPHIVYHPGGHAIPKKPGCADEVVNFLKPILRS